MHNQTDSVVALVRSPIPFAGRFFIALAIFSIGLLGLAVGTLKATYEETSSRALKLTGDVTTATGASTALWYGTFSSLGEEPIGVYFHVKLTDDAEVPLGIGEWPQRGSVMVSPAIAADSDLLRSAGVYGSVAGVISSSVLASPTEKLLYVFPDIETVDTEKFYPINGYGGTYTPMSEVMNRQPLWMFAFALVGLVGVGAISLASAAAAFAASQFGVTQRVLVQLGATRGIRVKSVLSHFGSSLLAGSILAFIALVIVSVVDITIPITGYVIRSVDVKMNLLSIALCYLLFTALGVGLMIWSALRYSARPKRNSRFSTIGVNRAASAVFVVAVALAIPLINYLVKRSKYELTTPVFLLVLITLLVTFPFFLSAISRYFGAAIAVLGRKLGVARWIVSGRHLQADPRPTSSTAAALALTIVLVLQVQLWTAALNVNREELASYYSSKGELLVSTTVDKHVENLAADLTKQGVQWVTVTSDFDRQGFASIAGMPETLAQLGVPLGTGRTLKTENVNPAAVREYLEAHRVNMLEVGDRWVEPGENQTAEFIVFAQEGEVLDVDGILALNHLLAAPGVDLGHPSEPWAVGAQIAYGHSQWVGLFGVLGSALLACSILLRSALATLRSNADVGPLAAIAADPEFSASVARTRSKVPTYIGLLSTLPLVAVSSYPFVAGEGAQRVPWAFLAVSAILILLAQMVISRFVSVESQNALARWRPGSTDISQFV